MTRDEACIICFDTVVARVDVGDHFPRIARCAQELPDKCILPDLLRPRYFERAIHWLTDGDLRKRGSDIIRRDRLHENGGQSNRCAFGSILGDASRELEELS